MKIPEIIKQNERIHNNLWIYKMHAQKKVVYIYIYIYIPAIKMLSTRTV